MQPFSPPRRTYPSGPLRRDSLANMAASTRSEIHVTKENVNQLAYFCDPITPTFLRRHCAWELTETDILTGSIRRELFRNWPSRDLDKVIPLAENFKLVRVEGNNAGVYFPATYWVDEELGQALRSGPFFVRPRSSTYRAKDLWQDADSGSISALSSYSRWRRVRHPHIDGGGSVCLGTEEDTYFNLKEAGDLYSLMCVFEDLLKTYNPDSPFEHFNTRFPGSVSPIEEPEKEHELFLSSGVYYEAVSKDWTDGDLVPVRVGGYQIRLLPREHDRILQNGPRSMAQWLESQFREYLPKLISGSSDLDEIDSRFYRLLKRILMPGHDWAARALASGINVAPSFNQSDAEMTASYTPYSKEHAIAFTPDHLDKAIQAENGNASEGETQENSGQEETSAADTFETHF